MSTTVKESHTQDEVGIVWKQGHCWSTRLIEKMNLTTLPEKKICLPKFSGGYDKFCCNNVPYTDSEIKTKLKNIKHAYKTAVDGNASTGASPTIEPYKDLLEELYDAEHPPETSHSQTIESGVVTNPIAIPVTRPNVKKVCETAPQHIDLPSVAPLSSTSIAFDDIIEVSLPEEEAKKSKPKKRKTAKDLFREKKLEHWKSQEENRERRYSEKMKFLREQEMAMANRNEERRVLSKELINHLKTKNV